MLVRAFHWLPVGVHKLVAAIGELQIHLWPRRDEHIVFLVPSILVLVATGLFLLLHLFLFLICLLDDRSDIHNLDLRGFHLNGAHLSSLGEGSSTNHVQRGLSELFHKRLCKLLLHSDLHLEVDLQGGRQTVLLHQIGRAHFVNHHLEFSDPHGGCNRSAQQVARLGREEARHGFREPYHAFATPQRLLPVGLVHDAAQYGIFQVLTSLVVDLAQHRGHLLVRKERARVPQMALVVRVFVVQIHCARVRLGSLHPGIVRMISLGFKRLTQAIICQPQRVQLQPFEWSGGARLVHEAPRQAVGQQVVVRLSHLLPKVHRQLRVHTRLEVAVCSGVHVRALHVRIPGSHAFLHILKIVFVVVSGMRFIQMPNVYLLEQAFNHL
mmetsp:Transcript_44323/g.84745  ORF Transcript_44323/g.84745 Transcript_44323/m.84745 type:complete len:381 (-) Transcript_44323:220-1362(-)